VKFFIGFFNLLKFSLFIILFHKTLKALVAQLEAKREVPVHLRIDHAVVAGCKHCSLIVRQLYLLSLESETLKNDRFFKSSIIVTCFSSPQCDSNPN
jgi:hypothetical protein